MNKYRSSLLSILHPLFTQSPTPPSPSLLSSFLSSNPDYLHTQSIQSTGDVDGYLDRYINVCKGVRNYVIDKMSGDKEMMDMVSDTDSFLMDMWSLYYPVFRYVKRDPGLQAIKGCKIIGVLGCQGSGKTRLSKVLAACLQSQGHKVVYFSSDDFYLSYADRLALKEKHPFLQFRGPPGTHDFELLKKTIASIKNGEDAQIPVFDKSLHSGQGDRSNYIPVPSSVPVDYCIFEGWFNGLLPLPTSEIGESQLSKFSNESLSKYGDWSGFIDRLIVIRPDTFQNAYTWRLQAEHNMRKAGKVGGMSDEQIKSFVDYFMESINPDKYYSHLIKSNPSYLGLLIDINSSREVTNMQKFSK